MKTFIFSLFLMGAPLVTFGAGISKVFPYPDRIRYDTHGLQIEGKDQFIFSGSFHYFRCPPELWAERFEKIKAAGFNCVETYVPWNWHERSQPASPDDFSKIGNLDLLDRWLTMAEHFGLYVIVRPGPYICSEWSGGGFPQWLVALKKPADYPVGKQWLQSDDPEFLKWADHWYRAVCPVIAKHQITRKKPGEPGVILFQIENEYERVRWLSHDVKRRYLENLATVARANGIDVPLFTCWTTDALGVDSGPLVGVFDMMNYYPGWNVQARVGPATRTFMARQPYAPRMSAELQASREPVQTQNLTLYALQLGYSLINYYMAFGGTNFDDWASRAWTTTYDSDYTVRENGGVGEKYRRVRGIGQMLNEHGASLMRSEPMRLEVSVSDPAVEVAEREAPDGGRFFFVRTEDRSGPHAGRAQIRQQGGTALAFDFSLEAFGSKVLYLPVGVTDPAQGEWLPKLGPLPPRPPAADLPKAVDISTAERFTDPPPTAWTALAPAEPLEKLGVFDRHFLYYQVSASAGREFTVERIGYKVVNGSRADGVLAQAGGRLLHEKTSDKNSVTFAMPAGVDEATLLFESPGLFHHTTPTVEKYWDVGLRGVRVGGVEVPLRFAAVEGGRGIALSNPEAKTPAGAAMVPIGPDAPAASEALLTWYRMGFELPAPKLGVWVPWSLHLEAEGNGFIYLNGRCLGRYWQEAPPPDGPHHLKAQRDFYLPECWLRFGKGQRNVIVLSLRPLTEVRVQAASIQPQSEFAEVRN